MEEREGKEMDRCPLTLSPQMLNPNDSQLQNTYCYHRYTDKSVVCPLYRLNKQRAAIDI
jgi:hypothetical protein